MIWEYDENCSPMINRIMTRFCEKCEEEIERLKFKMHYKNGREAKNGDKVMLIPSYINGAPVVGILYDATAGNDYCNGKIAPILPNDPMPNLKECLHLDDALSALNRNPLEINEA